MVSSRPSKISFRGAIVLLIALLGVWFLYPKFDELRRESLQENIEKQIVQEQKDDMMKKFMSGQKILELKPYSYKSDTVIAKGIKNPHGIYELDGQVYVSSEADRVLYKIIKGKPEKFVSLNFVHDMVALSNGTLLATVFQEDRVVSISKSGEVKTILKDLDGPNGIALIEGTKFLVSNYLSGTVVLANLDGSDSKTIITDMKGPAGIAVNKKNNTIYVADYIDSTVLVSNGAKSAKIAFTGLEIESLFFQNDKLYATVGLKTTRGIRGGVVELLSSGDFKVLIDPGLPSPLVGSLSSNGIIFLVSPNDPKGFVLRYPLKEK